MSFLDDFLKRNADLFDDLSKSILCPCCKEVCQGPFMNLGEKFNQAEGCSKCYIKLMAEEYE